MLKKIHLNAFPAIHLKNLDRLDFVLKFSGELLVLGLAAVAVFYNLYFFTGNVVHEYIDNSHAAKFLSYHPDLNLKLYAKNTVSITTLANNSGLFQQAQAESLGGFDYNPINENENYALAENSGDIVLNDGMLVTPNPDSIGSLISKQVKIYETKPKDTLKSIAGLNGISVQTLMWANNLTSEQIKPGWFLLILPTDGVLHKATSNDTLPDIAKKYKVGMDQIIAYNGLDSAEDIEGGKLIIVPGGVTPAPPKAPRASNSGKVNPKGTATPKVYDAGTGHTFPWGYCTYYVATKVHVPWGGNAKSWLANARSYGAVITQTASVGAIVVTTDNRRYGHVAYVESVDENGFTVSEMNYEKFGKVNTRWIPNGSKTIRGFILP